MSLSDISTIVVTTTGAGVTRQGFGVPMILSHTATWAERSRAYTSDSAVLLDFAANSPEAIAAGKIFGQSPTVPRIVIGRAVFQPTQKFSVGFATGATGNNQEFRLRVAVPTGVVFTSQDAVYNSGAGARGWVASNTWSRGDVIMGNTAHNGIYSCLGPSGIYNSNGLTGIGATMGPSGAGQAIQEGNIFWACVGSGITGACPPDAAIYGLWAKVDALGAPTVVATGVNNLTTSIQGSPGSRTLQLLANAPAKFFGTRVYNRQALTISQTQADPGIATDLAAVKLADSSWYGLVTLFNSEAIVDATAAWVESNTKLYPAASQDTSIPTIPDASATDAAHDFKAAGYARSWVFHHPSNDEFADAAELGRFFPISPGGETWRMKPLTGVTKESYTDTEQTNMKGKFAHFYFDIGGVGVVGGDAKSGSGEFIDVVRGLDWYTSELQAKLANLAIGLNKIPFTNAGIDLVEAKVRQQNAAGITAGLISPDPAPVVTAPDVTDISTEDKQDRELSGVNTTWTLAGAIHHITVNVTANV